MPVRQAASCLEEDPLAQTLIQKVSQQYSCSFLDGAAEYLLKSIKKTVFRNFYHIKKERQILKCLLRFGARVSEELLKECEKKNKIDSSGSTEHNQDHIQYCCELRQIMDSEQARKKRVELVHTSENPAYHRPNSSALSDIFSILLEVKPLYLNIDDCLDFQADTVLKHYYQRPHPVQVQSDLGSGEEQTLLRSNHGVDHVLRSMRLGQALADLCQRHSQRYQRLFAENPELERLLPLAVLYHDVTAEIAPKNLAACRT